MIRARFFSSRGGFTLIETLTAMMILSISLVTIFQLFSGGLRAGRFSEDYTRAIFHAREKMEEILLFDEMHDMESEGEYGDGFRWKASVSAVYSDTENGFQAVGATLELFNIDIRVTWDVGSRERDFELHTLQVAKKQLEK